MVVAVKDGTRIIITRLSRNDAVPSSTTDHVRSSTACDLLSTFLPDATMNTAAIGLTTIIAIIRAAATVFDIVKNANIANAAATAADGAIAKVPTATATTTAKVPTSAIDTATATTTTAKVPTSAIATATNENPTAGGGCFSLALSFPPSLPQRFESKFGGFSGFDAGVCEAPPESNQGAPLLFGRQKRTADAADAADTADATDSNATPGVSKCGVVNATTYRRRREKVRQ